MTNWDRLSKLAGMLGSPHDGERVNAARLLEQALQREGLTFADFAQRVAQGGGGWSEPRTVVVERWKPNPASQLARKIILTGKDKLSLTERAFLDDIVRSCEMTGAGYALTKSALAWIKDLERVYVLGTKRRNQRSPSRGPVPVDVLDDIGLGAKAGTFKGDASPAPRRAQRTGFKRTHTAARDVDMDDYRTRPRVVDDIPDARDDVETRGNSAWAARKVDLDFDDEIGF